MSWAIRRTLLILTRKDAAALLTISSDKTSSGNDCGCLLQRKKEWLTLEMISERKGLLIIKVVGITHTYFW